MTDIACTFAATPGPLYSTYEKITSQPGCCVKAGDGSISSAYGLNNTCHVLYYGGNAEPYRLTELASNAGNLSMSNGECVSLILKLSQTGEYSTGNGTGPSDAGSATKYGYNKCVVGASENPNSASSKKMSSGVSTSKVPIGTNSFLWLAMIVPWLLL